MNESLKKGLGVIVRVALLVLVTWILGAHRQQIQTNAVDGKRDSLAYWAAGKLLLNRENPYSPPDVLALQRSQGFAEAKPRMFRPLPWSTWIVLPLGLLDGYWAWVAWLAISLAALMISLRRCWRLYGDRQRPPSIGFVFATYLFAPVVGCFVWAQMSAVLLLGVVLFLEFEDHRPFWAGAALTICMAKPHIFIVLLPVLFVWILARKRWQLLSGLAAAIAVETLIALALDPHIFPHYRQMLQSEAIPAEFVPSLSGMIRVLFFRQLFWVQFVPAVLAIAWGAWYFWKYHADWNWAQHGPALLVASLLTTPYAKFQDETVLLPAILQGVACVSMCRLKARSQFAIIGFVLLDILLLLILHAQVDASTGIYFWSSLVWFSWYWYAGSFAQRSIKEG